MKLYAIKSEGIAHNSYMLIDGAEAADIDPRRDCKIYTRIAIRTCTKIRYIFETHRNEDYVVGSTRLKMQTDAEICHSRQLPFTYGDHNLDDGDTFSIGNLKIKTLYTPGHTNESVCYTLTDTQKTAQPFMVFTGDTLFVGSIGRTDLQGKDAQLKQAEKLFMSLHERLLPLGPEVLVYPGHGAGSVCGSEIGDQPFSTFGYEQKTNPFLRLSKQEFVEKCVAQEMIVPKYFAKMEDYNLHGARPQTVMPTPKALRANEFESKMREKGSVVVDTRAPYAFGGSHIKGALSLWFRGGTAVYSGWILGYDQQILLLVERGQDVSRVMRHLWRLGFDKVSGFLCPSMNDWQEQGKPIEHVPTLSASELKEKRNDYVILDVREPSEWHDEGVIEGAEQVFFVDLLGKSASLDMNKQYAVICSVGNRASVAASILQRKGFKHLTNVLGGMTAWQNLGYPTVNAKKG